jgi:hypothetical protein
MFANQRLEEFKKYVIKMFPKHAFKINLLSKDQMIKLVNIIVVKCKILF